MARIKTLLITLLLIGGAVSRSHAAETDQGILEIRLTDHRDAIDDFAQLIINIDKLSLSPKAGLKFWQTGWKELAVRPQKVDLTQYISGKSVQVFRAPVNIGTFDAFRLSINNIDAVLKKTQRKAAVKNSIGPFKLAYEIRPNTETLLILDLVVTDISDHPPGGYELGLKGYQLFVNGKLIEKIPPG
jgi:hypothetical protein